MNEGRDARGRGTRPALPLLPDPAVLRPLLTFLSLLALGQSPPLIPFLQDSQLFDISFVS